MSAHDLAQTIRFWTMSISDFLDEYFETDVLKAFLAMLQAQLEPGGPLRIGAGRFEERPRHPTGSLERVELRRAG